MTAQEQQMIQGLADRINKTPLSEKDPDAGRFLQGALGRNPDALYILAQTALVQGYALEQAQKQLADARSRLDQQRQQAQVQPKHASSFLGNLLGLSDEPARPAAPPPPPPSSAQPGFAPVNYPPAGQGYPAQPSGYGQSSFGQQAYGSPQYGQPQYGQPQSGGFLRSAMQTATGVAAGALAFEGIESLMHGFGGGGGGFGSGSGFGSGGGRPEEIVNNYYGDASPGEHGGHLSSDIEDRRGGSSFADAVTNDDHHDGLMGSADADDSSADDAGADDGDVSDDSSFDDGASADDSDMSGGGDDTNY